MSSKIDREDLPSRNIYYVFQGKTHDYESQGGYLWSPQRNKNGGRDKGYETMRKVKKGDIIFHGSNAENYALSIAKRDCYEAEQPEANKRASGDTVWNDKGYRIDSDYTIFKTPLDMRDHFEWLAENHDKDSAFNVNGQGKQTYLSELSDDHAKYLLMELLELDQDENTLKLINNILKKKFRIDNYKKQDNKCKDSKYRDNKYIEEALESLISLNNNKDRSIIESLKKRYYQEVGSIFYSWEIINNDVIIKTCDKSLFEHNGTGVPKETRVFWEITDLEPGGKRELKMSYEGKIYYANLIRERENNYRTRLMWRSDFGDVLRRTIPNYKKYEVKKEDYPLMRFERLSKNFYRIDIIVTEKIISDIEYEIEESYEEPSYDCFKEGQEVYFYGKRYERNIKNRREAIKIHGLKCVVCKFDFEKVYRERGLGFIEIHHKKPLYDNQGEVVVNPKEDLVPVCSNCHRMIHREKNNMLSIEKLKDIINN